MIDIISLYNDLTLDDVNKDQNGTVSYDKFNRWLHRASLRLLDWLTGNVTDVNPPEKISTQKARDLLSFLITKKDAQVTNGVFEKPEDYYAFRSFYRLAKDNVACDEDEDAPTKVVHKPIELLDNSSFSVRSSTRIKRLKPLIKPIAKLGEDGDFELQPKDSGSVVLEYYRYPKEAKIVPMLDPLYNNQVPNPSLSVNVEWPEGARGYLLFFMKEMFSLHTREAQFQQQNAAAKP